MELRPFDELYYEPLLSLLKSANEAQSLRALLDSSHPSELHNCLVRGANTALAEYRQWLTNNTKQAVNTAIANSQRITGELEPLWQQIDSYDRYGTWKGMAAGIFSEETGLGAAIGTALLPGIGSVIGGAIGGFIAGNRIDQQAKEAMQQYDNAIKYYAAVVDEDFQNRIVPAVNQDMTRGGQAAALASPQAPIRPSVVRAVLLYAFLLLLLAGAHWGAKALFMTETRAKQVEVVEEVESMSAVEIQIARPKQKQIRAFTYPTTQSNNLAVLSSAATYPLHTPDGEAPQGWISVELPEGKAGWVLSRDVVTSKMTLSVPKKDRITRTENRPESAFHFGKPPFTELAMGWYPLWLSITAVGILVLFIIYYASRRRSFFATVFYILLLAAAGHATIQGVNYLVTQLWGVA